MTVLPPPSEARKAITNEDNYMEIQQPVWAVCSTLPKPSTDNNRQVKTGQYPITKPTEFTATKQICTPCPYIG